MPDIAGPPVIFEHRPCVVGEHNGWHHVLFGTVAGKLSEQEGNIFFSVTQWGNANGNRVQAVVEILPELSLFDGFYQVEIGRGNHSNVAFLYLRRAYFYKLTALQHSQQSSLGREWKFSRLIEEKCPSVGYLKISFTRARCTGKRTFFVPEKLRVDGAFGDGAAINREIGPMLAFTVLVYDLRKALLAHSALSRDKH